ncbi:MAG TPA: hypothetical protein VMW16_04905 [Sedimentisphaerales bacterium]|nr:hypothetical protein [Sedimentisphaerales bacterium]
MDAQPDFLPPMINLDGSYEEIIERLYNVFRKDFIESKALHLKRRVAFNAVINEFSQGKVEGFWHVVTRQNGSKTSRLIDYRRAERLPWAKPLMELPEHSEVISFWYYEGSDRMGIRHYIWFKQGHYAVILKKRKYDYYWITAFYVEPWKEDDLFRRFQNRMGS